MEAIAWTTTIIFCVVLMGWMVFFMGACIYFTLERARYYRTMRKYNKKHPDTPMIEFKKIKKKGEIIMNKKAKKLLKMVDNIKFYLTITRLGDAEHKRAYNKLFDLQKKLENYRIVGFNDKPSCRDIAIPLNEMEITLLIELLKGSEVLENDK